MFSVSSWCAVLGREDLYSYSMGALRTDVMRRPIEIVCCARVIVAIEESVPDYGVMHGVMRKKTEDMLYGKGV